MTNPSVTRKKLVLDSYTAEAVAAGSFNGPSVEVPRGAEKIQYHIAGTLFDATTGDEDYQFRLQGRSASGDAWEPIPGMEGTLREGVTSGDEVLPTPANAPGVVLPRFVRAQLTSLGTSPIATAELYLTYESTGAGGGRQHQANYQGG